MSSSKEPANPENDYFTIAFYNLENLFDTKDDLYTNDDGFLPNSERRWTEKRYRKKLRKLGYTISKIGKKASQKPPVVVGLAEVENQVVVEDLIQSKFLKDRPYDFVHYDSPDERGIDTAMIYDTRYFEVVRSEVHSLKLLDENGEIDHTRDILEVEGLINGELVHILVNHWPSRREGADETAHKRIAASSKLIEIVNERTANNPEVKILIMGDFNDDPTCQSIKNLINETNVYNPMDVLLSYSRGSLSFRLKWNLFDQIMFTTNFFEFKKDKHSFSRANIFDQQFLKQFKGKYRGNPFRTYVGRKYKGGYSDHFPVYLLLKKG